MSDINKDLIRIASGVDRLKQTTRTLEATLRRMTKLANKDEWTLAENIEWSDLRGQADKMLGFAVSNDRVRTSEYEESER